MIRKKVKLHRVIIGIIIVILALTFFLFHYEYLRLNHSERELISAALRGNHSGVGFLYYENESDLKQCRIIFYQKRNCSAEDINQLRTNINTYLSEHPSMYLNQKYHISVSIKEYKRGPTIIRMENVLDIRVFDQKYMKQYDDLLCVESQPYYPDLFSRLSDFETFTDIKFLKLGEYTRIDDLSILTHLASLEYIYLETGFSQEEKDIIQRLLPSCKILY